jgi:integrase
VSGISHDTIVTRKLGSMKTFESKVSKHHVFVEKLVKAPVKGRDPQVWKDSVASMLYNVQCALSDKTAASYQYWWGRFEDFCSMSKRPSLPFSTVTAAAFFSFLAEGSAGIGGVDLARAALHYYWGLKYPDKMSPTDSVEVRSVVTGIKRRFKAPVSKKKPLTVKDFSKVLNVSTEGGDLKGARLCQVRLAAQVSIMFGTFSRFEEASSLKIRQVERRDGGLDVVFEKGKQYQFGEARVSSLPSQPHLPLDPVAVICAYIDRLVGLGAGADSWLFPAVAGVGSKTVLLDRPASYGCVLKQFKLAAEAAGVEGSPRDYGLHSMRRGAVTGAANKGCSDHVIMKQMRVASVSTVQMYASLDRPKLAEASNALFLS